MLNEIEHRQLPDWLQELRAHPLDDDYNPPHKGGCWICRRGNGYKDNPEHYEFNTEFDTFYHKKCLDQSPYESILEFERNIRQIGGDDA